MGVYGSVYVQDAQSLNFWHVCACVLTWWRTLSRLSTSARKPEIMGTSMTAMLDEPEWSHLDRESGSEWKLGIVRSRAMHWVQLLYFYEVCVSYLAQTSKEMWKSILSWWAAGSSSSMGARRFRLSSERLSARLREREEGCREDEEEGCRCRSWKGSFRSTLSWKAGLDTGSGRL